MLLTPGQTHEMRVAEELLREVHNAYVIGDSAYSAKSLVDSLLARGCTVVIPANPTHRQRDYDAHLYKDRHLWKTSFSASSGLGVSPCASRSSRGTFSSRGR